MTRAALLAAAGALLLAAAGPASAQLRDTLPGDPVQPLIFQFDSLLRGARPAPRILMRAGTRPVTPLDPAQAVRFRQAAALREAGSFDRAREILAALAREVPHQPLVVTELARVDLARQDWAAVERLARQERQAQRDSLLLGEELAAALGKLGRPREVAKVALEVWVAAAEEAEWAMTTLQKLAPADIRPAREELRRVVTRLPERGDLAAGLARLQWYSGDLPGALQTLAALERPGAGAPLRWSFAGELLRSGAPRDSSGALELLLALAGDAKENSGLRMAVARHAWDVAVARGAERDLAPRVRKALHDIPSAQWDGELLLAVARGLRETGLTGDARALLQTPSDERPGTRPGVELERLLSDLRDGPPEHALPGLEAAAPRSNEGAFRYAEALFFAGQTDSALAWYQRAAADASAPFAGAALERTYLIEDADPKTALVLYGRMAYEEWRGEDRRAVALADSLVHALPRGPLWAHAAIELGALRASLGEPRVALVPLLALADSLPGDRLAPLARQRAGDLYLNDLKDDAHALAQYEECLARYPRAWNAAEVRRRVEQLRRDRRL